MYFYRKLKPPQSIRLSKVSALYIHIPFCKKLCAYCDFYKSISLAKVEPLCAAIERDMESRRAVLDKTRLHTIYFGGGTPSLLPPEQLQKFIKLARKLWHCGEVTEITAEANPDDLTFDYVTRLVRSDINRLSIGIQSFIDRDLMTMQRRHTAQQAVEAVQLAQRAGFKNISIDLIYGIPGMTLDEWEYNLQQAVELGVQHISAYHLTIEPATIFGRRGVRPVDEQISSEEYKMLCRALGQAGFEHYEISNFALAGYHSQHNSSYWRNETYLGVGPSAHSYDGSRRSWAVASVEEYIKSVGTEELTETELLSEQDKYNEFVMVSLRTNMGVDCQVLREKFGARKLQLFEQTATRMAKYGIMKCVDGHWIMPEDKWLVSDSVICEFFE